MAATKKPVATRAEGAVATRAKGAVATRAKGAKGAKGAKTAGDYLDRATLVRTAADLADEVGWSKLTLSLVAKRVDRHVTSLYAHVDSLAALHREVALLATEELADTVWKSALARTREDALRAIAEVYLAFSLTHQGRAAAMMAIDHRNDPEFRAVAARLAEPVQATFRSFGLDDEQVAVAHRVFSATVRGLTIGDRTEHRRGEDERIHTFDQVIGLFSTALASGHWPAATSPEPRRRDAAPGGAKHRRR